MKRLKTYAMLLLAAAMIVGCSKCDTLLLEEGGAEVTVAVGSASTLTKAPFAKGTLVEMYIYQRADAATKDLTAQPYKVVGGTANGYSSTVSFTTGDLTSGKLYLDEGHTYDFVLVANKSAKATMERGIISNLSHGSDIMAGRKEGVVVAEGATSVVVKFTEYGADESGNLPRLTSGIAVEATASEQFISNIGSSLTMSIQGVTLNRYPKLASLDLDASTMALNVSGSDQYAFNCDNAKEVDVTDPEQKATWGDFALPYPLEDGLSGNFIDLDLLIAVNGVNLKLAAESVKIPEFKPGYRYTFIAKLDADGPTDGSVSLLLKVEDWGSLSWEGGIGGSGQSNLFYNIGSWDNLSWTAGMGGSEDERLQISVYGWASVNWSSEMGKNDELIGVN